MNSLELESLGVEELHDAEAVGCLPARFLHSFKKLEEFILELDYNSFCIEEGSKFRITYRKHPLWERFIISFFLDETLLLKVGSSKKTIKGYRSLYDKDLKDSEIHYILDLWKDMMFTLGDVFGLKDTISLVLSEVAIKASFLDQSEKLLVCDASLLPETIVKSIYVGEYAYSGLLEVLQKFLATNSRGINLSSPEVLGLGSEPYSFTLVLDYDLNSPHTRLLVSHGEVVLFTIFLASGSISLNKGDSPLLYSLDDELLLELNSYIKTSLDYISNNSDLIWNVAYVKFNLENALVLDRFGIANIFEVTGVN